MIIALQTLVFFRESLLSVVDRLLGPYFNRFTLTFARHISEDEEEEEEEVYAEFDDEKGVIFYPPVYAQRYAAVTDCLMDERWCGKLEKVIDLGYHDMSFIKYLKDVPGVHTILGVDIETIPLRCSSDLLGCEEYAPIRENPLQVTLFEGNAADPDYRLIGCDAVIAIEMIEHMLPHDLDRLVHNVFGFVKPWVAVITTPNGDFNVLFKKLEKNGLRRLDHFFEWSREQFHDWCSNIVVRYPQFTVSCKGVGPGPVGTHHVGCCSQLALFVNKDYHKQPDLNLNSLALVTDIPTRDNIADMYAGWDTPIPKTVDMIPHDKMESLSDFLSSDKKSCVTIVIASAITMDRLVYCDKMSQCNLDSEVGKNFLMFNDEDMCCSMLAPRRKLEFKVYEIEDVNSRLNCTTFSVTKFSKQTQNMMAKHKIDSLVHTREVVSEIQHLTKMLNFHDMSTSDDSTSIWCNINWGENAPYWNQYYKIIRNYNYPFEAKSEECRILDLISEEINRLIDMEYRDNAAKYADKFEIPIEILMNAVKHITDDTMRVKDLLEWNGYEIQGNMVLYSRLVVDHTSVTTGEEEWPEFDTESDYETTDGRSTTFSDGSTVTPDFHGLSVQTVDTHVESNPHGKWHYQMFPGRGLRRALDKKVRGLRALLSADEDISTELDRVVCRLMKLALFTCKGKQTPPPTKWMQCKLLDLLTLTEKAIARRKRHCLEKFAFKAIGFGQEGNESSLAIDKMKEDNANVKKIVAKYIHILESDNIDDYNTFKYRYDDDVLTRDIASNATIKDFEFSDMNFSQTLDHNFESTERMSEDDSSKNRAWIEKDNLEVVPYHEHNLRTFISPLDYTYNSEIRQFKKINKIPNTSLRIQEDKKPYRRSHSAETKHENKSKMKRSKNNLKNISYSFVRNYKKRIATSYFGNYGLKTKKKIREHTNLQSTSSKPIPGSFVALCHPDLKIQANSNFHQPTKVKRRKDGIDAVNNLSSDIAATEESVLIDIVMDDMEETIALRRSIGTDADSISQLNKKIDNEVKDVALDSELQVKTENVHSQTIFLYDINEPSTSKGIRHVSMDVQCCTDATTLYPSLSPVSSLTRPTQMFGTCIKIDDSLTNINMKKVNHTDNSAATSNIVQNFGPTSLRIRSANRNLKGIKIEDSFTDMTVMSSDFGTCTNDDNYEKLSSYPTFRSPTRHSVGIKIRDSVSDLRKICNSGTSTDELKDISQPMSICTESPSKCTKGITVTDSYTDIYTGQHFDFGTVTNNAIEQYKTANTEYKSPEYNEAQMESTFEHDVASTTDSLIQTNTNGVLDSGDNTDNNDDIITENVVSKMNVTNIENGCSQTNFKIKIDSSSTSENPTYYNEMPNVNFTKGIKSTDYLIGADYIFPTMTDHKIDMRCRSPSPVNISFGFKVKGDDGNITKCVEWSSTRIELSDFHTPFLKHPPSMTESKLTHSGSEFYENYCCSYPQRNLYFTDSSINTSASQSKGILSSEVMVDQKLSPSKLLKSKLSCGGVQIHSYKEKQVSEDIVFQGEWQQPNPKSRQKQNKTPMNPSPTRNFTEISNKSKRIAPTDKPCLKKNAQKLEVKTEIKKPAQVRNRAFKSKQETGSKTEQLKRNELPKNQVRTMRNKNVLKVSSKIAVNSITSKSTRNAYSSKRLSKQPPKNHIAFGRGSTINKDPKKHLAPMHTKKYCTMEKSNLNQSFGAIETVIRGNEGKSRKATSLIRRSKTEIGMELIRMSHEIRENLTYVVFRNELENNHKNTSNNDPIDNANKSEGTSRKRIINRRSSSPLSQNSSTCSTPDSIATVTEARTKLSARKHCGHSPSSNKSSVSNSDTDPISPVRNRKYKRYKSGKYSEDKSNKENVAESSLKCKISDNVQNVKNSFMGRSKNIYLAQVANESALTLNSKHQIPNKSFIPTVAGSDERKKYENSSIMMKKSVVRDSFMKGANENQGDPSNVVFVVGPLEKLESNASQHTATDNDSAIVNVVDNTLLAEWLAKGSSSELDIDSTESTILATMKQIVEDRLDFITAPLDINELTNMDAQIHEDGIEQELDETSSLKSFQTVITKDDKIDYIETQNITDIAFNSTFESAQDIPSPMSIDYQTDYDLVSFKSSTSASKLSEYFLTDDSKKSENMPPDILTISSVRDIFERKEYISPKPAGMLAVQAFSGFSIDAEPVSGDQPDYVNFVDSDVGSFAVDVARQAASGCFAKFADSLICQKPDPVNIVDSETGSGTSVTRTRIIKSCETYSASISQRPDPINTVDSETGSILKSLTRRATSEELFISGRSSESYESCIIDEDAVVPNWLFNIINQQFSMDIEEDQPINGPLPAPAHTEPMYDLNGNVPEPGMGVGAGAGAGDGRGMHSDNSQDSSGRGTSLSSSDTSSGQQSEAILIDPSAFTAQFEHDSIGSSAGVNTLMLPLDGSRPENLTRNTGADNEMLSTSRHTRIIINPVLAVSDGEADVSSLDTDAPDSSDN